MSRPSSPLALILTLLVLAVVGPVTAQSEPPLIVRAEPDPEQRARLAGWLAGFEGQRPALERAREELERERDYWRSSAGTRRCARAAVALGAVDPAVLFRTADYRLVAAAGRAFDQLSGAVAACRERRYFELDYRLGIAARALDSIPELVRTVAGGPVPRPRFRDPTLGSVWRQHDGP